jgi:hypothetical protein
LLVLLVHREILAPKDPPDHKDRLDCRDFKVYRALPVLPVRREILARKDPSDHKDRLDHKDLPDPFCIRA